MKILIVDDSPLIRKRLKDFLEDQDYDVFEADNGLDAVKLYNQHKPDVAFMDILMPKLDGLTAMAQILNEHPKAKIIILSSMGQQSKIIEAIQSGATDFIVKPFEPGKVIAAIEKAYAI
ncbi:MAG: response regulator [Candidatus Margulisbacteria bacterium]|nr:response regulator [Candidatus Margulisiibacteriota bacterium]